MVGCLLLQDDAGGALLHSSASWDVSPNPQTNQACPVRVKFLAQHPPTDQVVDVCDVAGSGGRAVLLKQPHQVAKLAVQVAKDLDRRFAKGRAWEKTAVLSARRHG